MNGGGAIVGGSARGARLFEAAAITFALLIAFSAFVRADEHTAGPSRAADANHAVSSSPPGSNSTSAVQPTRSSPFDELPIKHHAEDTSTPAPSSGGSGTSPQPSAPSLEAPRVLLALALVVGLIFGLRWAARRFFATPGATGGSGAVQVLSRSPLSPRQQVVLIRVGRRVLVVSDNGQQLSSLAEISEADEVAALLGQVRSNGTSPAKPFGNFFQRFTATAEAQAESRAMQEAGGNEAKLDVSEDPAAVAATRAELGNLMEQVRLVSRELGRS